MGCPHQGRSGGLNAAITSRPLTHRSPHRMDTLRLTLPNGRIRWRWCDGGKAFKAERGAAELHLLRGLTHNRERRILGWPAVVAFHQHRAFPNEARGLAMKRPGDRHAL